MYVYLVHRKYHVLIDFDVNSNLAFNECLSSVQHCLHYPLFTRSSPWNKRIVARTYYFTSHWAVSYILITGHLRKIASHMLLHKGRQELSIFENKSLLHIIWYVEYDTNNQYAEGT